MCLFDHTGIFLEKALNIANKWRWNDETKSVIDTLPHGYEAFQSVSYVKLDVENWKIIGAFAKLAG